MPRLRDLSRFAQKSRTCICIIPKERFGRKRRRTAQQCDCAATGGTARSYSGVCDGLGEVASSAGGGVGEVADAAGYAAPPDMNAPVNLSCLTRSLSL